VVEIPNAFTPDGDEVNNLFRPVVLKGNIILEKLEIYNRWGQRIFTASPNTPYWDGNVDGKPAPVDTYLYQMVWRTTDGAMQAPRTGEVTLLR
jgi:gliding motility-associated-like protein